jgi:hypothetical protein
MSADGNRHGVLSRRQFIKCDRVADVISRQGHRIATIKRGQRDDCRGREVEGRAVRARADNAELERHKFEVADPVVVSALENTYAHACRRGRHHVGWPCLRSRRWRLDGCVRRRRGCRGSIRRPGWFGRLYIPSGRCRLGGLSRFRRLGFLSRRLGLHDVCWNNRLHRRDVRRFLFNDCRRSILGRCGQGERREQYAQRKNEPQDGSPTVFHPLHSPQRYRNLRTFTRHAQASWSTTSPARARDPDVHGWHLTPLDRQRCQPRQTRLVFACNTIPARGALQLI